MPLSMQRRTSALRKLSENQNRYKNKINDYKMLAFASKRAGRQDNECKAYLSMGVLYDNMREWKQSIVMYEKYLELCKQLGDVQESLSRTIALG